MSSSIPPGVTRLREHHESTTRSVILKAARRLFAERGYQATPIRLLARQSGVAVQTIYSTFGSKVGVLQAMPDLLDEEAGVWEIIEELDQTEDPRAILALYARLRRQFRERCGDIIHILRTGAASEPELATTVAEGMRRRRFGLTNQVRRIGEMGMLKEGLSIERASDIAFAIASDDVADILVDQGGWTFDDFEAWLGDTLATLLLRDENLVKG